MAITPSTYANNSQNIHNSQNTQATNKDDPRSPNHPLCLHQNDHPGLILITGSNNYGSWKSSMMIALNAKNKLKIITFGSPIVHPLHGKHKSAAQRNNTPRSVNLTQTTANAGTTQEGKFRGGLVAELRMLRWHCCKTMLDMIPNGVFRAELEVESIVHKMREGRLRWFGHVMRRPKTTLVRRVKALFVNGLRRRCRPKLRWEKKKVYRAPKTSMGGLDYGSIKRFKASLVTKGFTQKEGNDYNKTFALVAKMVTVRNFLFVAVHHGWHIAQLDINNAFPHGYLLEEVYMALPQGYKPTSSIPHTKGIYFLTLVIYVNDILQAGKNDHLITHFKKKMDQEFNIKDLGNLKYYIGIEFLRNKQGVTMTQRKYALELIHTTSVLDLKPSHILIEPNIKLNDTNGDPLLDASLYRAVVGKLIYLTITRPDISYAAHCLSQFSHSPRKPHFDALVNVLRYTKLCLG
ncbi:cysteine-rich receptor-like protein kinase 8 [Tanacetum coccineum]